MFRFGTAAPVEDLCYVAVDSSFTNPAVELVGGYLGVVKVVVVHYGSRCGGGSVEAKAYPGLWFNADLTSSVARYYEKRTGVELLERKKHGKADFDVLLLDGDLIPRSLSSRGSVGELHQKIADYTSKIIELADSTDTAVVGVLKRSYSRDLVSIMGFSDLRLSDKAVMSLILKPSEYVVAGSHPEIYGELKKLRGKPGVPGDWLEARLRWYEFIVRNMPRGFTVKLAYYRAPATIYPVATKIEFVASGSLGEDELVSSLMQVSGETGIPVPVDYADSLSAITKELKQTVYQKLLAELSKTAGVEARDAVLLLSLTNPEKLRSILS